MKPPNCTAFTKVMRTFVAPPPGPVLQDGSDPSEDPHREGPAIRIHGLHPRAAQSRQTKPAPATECVLTGTEVLSGARRKRRAIRLPHEPTQPQGTQCRSALGE
eukprot:6020280-Prymnesium_polylepis.2